MSVQFKFEELRVYQAGVSLSAEVFSLTSAWPTIFRYSLGDQLNRAALSIPLNIAEGSSRTGKDFRHFLSISRGSCFECIPILTIAKEKNLLEVEKYEALKQVIFDIAKMLSSLRSKITT